MSINGRETATERFLRAEVSARRALTAEQYAVLSLVVRRPAKLRALGVREMATDLRVSKPVVTRAIKALIAAHLADKTRVKGDQRLVDVTATDKGRATIARMVAA